MIARKAGARRTKSAPVDEGEKAYRERCERLRNAWKNSASNTTPKTGDRWNDAVVAAASGLDIKPLANYLSDVGAGREPALTPPQLDNLAALLQLLHARSQKRKPGKPRGLWRRWSDPNYVAANIAEVRIALWKRDNGKRKVPETIEDDLINNVVAESKSQKWAVAKRKPVTFDRVKALLREPRSRRLPV